MTLPTTSFQTGMDPRFAGLRLTVDLNAVIANWKQLHTHAPGAEIGAVVKANSYGLGAQTIGAALFEAGCRSFFVALPEEGIELRQALRSYDNGTDAEIYVLNGLVGGREAAGAVLESNLFPALNSFDQMDLWQAALRERGALHPSALHVDTGMNRLGLRAEELNSFLDNTVRVQTLNTVLLMSHLACGDDADNAMNGKQLDVFRALRSRMPNTRASFANSAGHFLGDDYHFDVTRPGICLYGGEAQDANNNPMASVAKLESRIIQIHIAKAGETIGYGATHKFSRDTKIAICSAGYADGYHRTAGGSVRKAFVAGQAVPVVGRVSMDLVALDVNDVSNTALEQTEWAELFGDNIKLDDLARACGTIGYEILTSIGNRAAVTYLPNSEN